MWVGYEEHLQLDRVDVNGNYEPNNCRWITRRENNRNKRTNVIYEFDGKKLTQAEWCERLGIKSSTLHYRITMGWPMHKILSTPKIKYKK